MRKAVFTLSLLIAAFVGFNSFGQEVEQKSGAKITVPTCPQEPLAPGQTATIKVKYDTNRVGPINKSVTITSNASNEPNKVIRIKGNIKAKPAETNPTDG